MIDPFPPQLDWRALAPEHQRLIYEEMQRHFQQRRWLGSILHEFRAYLENGIEFAKQSRDKYKAEHGDNAMGDLVWLTGRIFEANLLSELLTRAVQALDEGKPLPEIDIPPDPHYFIEGLNHALYGVPHGADPRSPKEVWESLLDDVRGLPLKTHQEIQKGGALVDRRTVAEWLRAEATQYENRGASGVWGSLNRSASDALKVAAAHFEEPEPIAELVADD